MESGRIDPGGLWHGLPAALGAAGPVDRVELKVIVDVPLEDAMTVLGTDVQPPMLRRIHFLDTPDLRLSERGVVVRVRETRLLDGGSEADVVVKLRRGQRAERHRYCRLRIELDALPTSTIWSATSRRTLGPARVSAALLAPDPAERLLSASQRRMLRSLAGPDVGLAGLVAHGAVDVVRLRSAETDNRVCVESWRFPDGSRLVELSVKCRPERAARAVAVVRDLIGKSGLTIADRQVTKTRFALRRLSGWGRDELPVRPRCAR